MNPINTENLALLITDPQNDFLSPDGVTWGVGGDSVTQNHTVENIETLFQAATAATITPELGDGYASAVTNFGFIANGVLDTAEAASAISATA